MGAYPTDELYDNMKFLTVGLIGHYYAALMPKSNIMHGTTLFPTSLALYASVCSKPEAIQ
ncbi:hypothetical protein DBV23_06285 [Edwardsiella ictaluri]|nr:hypothetical protein DBV23_06285 [Edwardsiella ictaluri]